MTPARAREARQLVSELIAVYWTEDDVAIAAKYLARAVVRERAAWKREIKKLSGAMAANKFINNHEILAYRLALDDLLQRRAQKGERP